MKPEDSREGSLLPVAERIACLITGFLCGTLSGAAHDELDGWVVASDEHMHLFEELTGEVYWQAVLGWDLGMDKRRVAAALKRRLHRKAC